MPHPILIREDWVVAKSEFWKLNKTKKIARPFVLVKSEASEFPICIYKIEKDTYVASLLECTHRGCELNVGGGIYSCPCHGSEFFGNGKGIGRPSRREFKNI